MFPNAIPSVHLSDLDEISLRDSTFWLFFQNKTFIFFSKTKKGSSEKHPLRILLTYFPKTIKFVLFFSREQIKFFKTTPHGVRFERFHLLELYKVRKRRNHDAITEPRCKVIPGAQSVTERRFLKRCLFISWPLPSPACHLLVLS